MNKTITIYILSAFAAVIANAAVINWDTATNVAGASDVSTNGSLFEAFNLSFNGNSSSPTSVTVNTVTFSGLGSPSPLDETSNATPNYLNGGDTGDAGYNTLLNNAAFGGGTSTSMSLGGSLIEDQDYEIQIWFVEQRGGGQAGRSMTYGDGLGNTVTLAGDGGSFGQYATGTFTADATGSQTLSLATSGFGNAHLTAYQLRAIPEPSSFALLAGLLGLGWVMARRR